MWWRRVIYLVSLLCCLVFYVFYREWFSWFLLVAVTLLPWFSLLLSLPGMLSVKASLRCPPSARQGLPVRTALRLDCKVPAPPVSCNIRLVNNLTGARYLGKPGELIPTDHCGMLTISYPHMFVYDYLGLFSRRLHKEQTGTICITPRPVPAKLPLEPAGRVVNLWKPKPGGGFSENHELRLYRPGDDLRHIHWKMAAKTGKLIYREPMEPALKGYVLTLCLSGTPKELDTKLGNLLWTSQSLLERNLPHQVRCMTGKGLVCFTVEDGTSLEQGLNTLLSSPKAENSAIPAAENVLWQHHIGGDSNEP